jgi:hypothetical protein
MGDVDTSAAKNFLGSLRSATTLNSASPSPPAFAPQQQSSFAPPPVRRGASNASPRVIAPGPPPVPFSRPQEEKGDLADVIYDYDSGVRVHYTERWHGIKEPTNPYNFQSFL